MGMAEPPRWSGPVAIKGSLTYINEQSLKSLSLYSLVLSAKRLYRSGLEEGG